MPEIRTYGVAYRLFGATTRRRSEVRYASVRGVRSEIAGVLAASRQVPRQSVQLIAVVDIDDGEIAPEMSRETQPPHRLTDVEREGIRAATGSLRAVGARFGVSPGTVWNIRNAR